LNKRSDEREDALTMATASGSEGRRTEGPTRTTGKTRLEAAFQERRAMLAEALRAASLCA